MSSLPERYNRLQINKKSYDSLYEDSKKFLTKKSKECAIVIFLDLSGSTELSNIDVEEYRIKVFTLFQFVDDFLARANNDQKVQNNKFNIPKTLGDGILISRNFGANCSIMPTDVLITCQIIANLVNTLIEAGLYVKVGISMGSDLLKGISIQEKLFEQKITINDNKNKIDGANTIDINEHGGEGLISTHLSSDDLWGVEVNRCARIESFAGKGQILISEQVAEELKKAFKTIKKLKKCNIDTTTGLCPSNCNSSDNKCKEPEFRLIGLTPQFSQYTSYQYMIEPKGFKEPFPVRQIALCKNGKMPKGKSHILSNYSFGCFVTFRCDKINDAINDKKRNTHSEEAVKAFNCSFPWPQTTAIYHINRESLFTLNGYLSKSQEKWDLVALLLSTDFYDFTLRMERLTSTKSGPSYEYTSTHPIFRIEQKENAESSEDIKFLFDCCSMYSWDNPLPNSHNDQPKLRFWPHCLFLALKLGNHMNTVFAGNALNTLKKNGNFLDGWLSLGFYDLILIKGLENVPEDDEIKKRIEVIFNKCKEDIQDHYLRGFGFIGEIIFPPKENLIGEKS